MLSAFKWRFQNKLMHAFLNAYIIILTNWKNTHINTGLTAF